MVRPTRGIGAAPEKGRRRLGRSIAGIAAVVFASLAMGAGLFGLFDRRANPWVYPSGVVSLTGEGVVGQDYLLVNPSPHPLAIRVQPSCGCTRVEAPKMIPSYSIVTANVLVDTAALPFGTSPKDLFVVADDGQTTRELRLCLNVTRKENPK